MTEQQQLPRKFKARKAKANYENYCQLLSDTFGEMRRDVFSGELHWNNRGRWLPILSPNTLGKLKSISRDSFGFFSAAAMDDHIYRLTLETPLKLLIDLPDYDGGQRLAEIARSLELTNLDYDCTLDLLKDWGARLFRKLYDPIQENRILIMKGGQGIGKDHLCKQMLGGLGDYLIPFCIFQNERDTMDQLKSGLVMHLSEYDRTSRTDVATLKNMITLPRTRFRGAYARVAEFHSVRSSFIATCNVDSILRDWTGNRRYLIFDIKTLSWRYPQGDSLQILAEWKKLSSEGFKAGERAERVMAEYIDSQTPGNPEDELTEDFREEFSREYPGEITKLSSEMGKLWTNLSRLHGFSVQTIRAILRRRGYGGHTGTGTKYSSDLGSWKNQPDDDNLDI